MRRGAFGLGAAFAACAIALVACGGPAQENGRLIGLKNTIEQAKANGALRCAPRELALAETHAEFAQMELDQGFLQRADADLAIAVPNAHAALALSPPEKCTDRPIVVAKKPKPGDRDGDGFLDPEDKCPDVPENFNGYMDDDGCPDDPDTDGDGLADSRDSCPNVPEDKDGYLDDDGCPDPDNDGDAILDYPNKVDKCPDQPEDPDGFEDADGCPEPDNDKDGVMDLDDACPIDPGPADNKGCPKKPALVVVTSSQIKITQQIHFEFNKSKIKADSFPILNAVVEVLKENPDITLEIGGHTDNVGGAAYNKTLSQSRADAVRTYLISHGIGASRLTARGYGMDVPIDTNSTEAGRAKNRRVEFVRTDSASK
jgi:outer membrane protein OmpA-like peptidoglycan-associated protein